VFVPDVVDAFEKDHAALVLRTPKSTDLDCARAANAPGVMRTVEDRAVRFLKRTNGDGSKARFVTALLACAKLAQGEAAAARDLVRDLRPLRVRSLSRENAVISATIYATGAARAIEAHGAAVAMLAGKMDIETFVLDWGSFASIRIPAPDAPGYAFYKERAIAGIRRDCFDDQDEKRRERARAELRRSIGELIYNEAASMLVVLRQSDEAIERWLATVAVGHFVVYSKLMGDLVPDPLSESQKQWQREQAFGAFQRAKKIAETFLSRREREGIEASQRWRETPTHDAAYRQLWAQLLDAEIVVMGWITTR